MSTARACHVVRGASLIAGRGRRRSHFPYIRPYSHEARTAGTATVSQSVPTRLLRRRHGHHAASLSSSARTDLTSSNLPSRVKIVEVGPRDGLQNEPDPISADDKVELVRLLVDAGCPAVEVAAFVSPRWVPQMADSDEVMRRSVEGRRRRHGNDDSASTTSSTTTLSCLTPNLKGFERAMESDPPDEVAIFASASEAFSQANINCSIAESIGRYREVAEAAKATGLPLRGYVSCVLGCPYQGHVNVNDVADVASRLADMGCREVSLGDTIGVGTPGATLEMIGAVRDALGGGDGGGDGDPPCSLAVHFHDTYGQALANIYAALTVGVDVVDCSVGGLGGCPYAGPGASGNVATEDVVYMLHGMGIDTGIDLDGLVRADEFICKVLNRPTRSRAAAALMARKANDAGAAADVGGQ